MKSEEMTFRAIVKCRMCGDELASAPGITRAQTDTAISEAMNRSVCPKPGHMLNAALRFEWKEETEEAPPPAPIAWETPRRTHVDTALGDDATADGTEAKPYKTFAAMSSSAKVEETPAASSSAEVDATPPSPPAELNGAILWRGDLEPGRHA